MTEDFVCPMPMKWNDIHTSLLAVWRKAGSPSDDKPPLPPILGAWCELPLIAKIAGWNATVEWADRHNCRDLIPELKEEEKFRG